MKRGRGITITVDGAPLRIVLGAESVRAGASVVAVLEGAQFSAKAIRQAGALWGQWERLAEGLTSRLTLLRQGVPFRSGWGIVAAQGAHQVETVTVAPLHSERRPIKGSQETLACDMLCLSYGFMPSNRLSRMLGAKQEWRPDLGGEVPHRDRYVQTSLPGVYAVGDGAGVGGGPPAMLEGQIAGIAAAARTGHGAGEVERTIQRFALALARERRFQQMYAAPFTPGAGFYEWSQDDSILCRCKEITRADVRKAIGLGANSANEVKATIRCRMGDCQGRMRSHLAAHCIARETGPSLADVGLFRPRPPILPVPVVALGQPAQQIPSGAATEAARQ